MGLPGFPGSPGFPVSEHPPPSPKAKLSCFKNLMILIMMHDRVNLLPDVVREKPPKDNMEIKASRVSQVNLGLLG